jgi:hypothetical protein
MSKQIKQMEMEALHNTFQSVRDLAVLSVKGLNSLADYSLRASLRKKKIRLQVIKNSLCRRVFKDLGLDVPEDSPYWLSTTMLAWSTENAAIAELCRALDAEINNPKLAAQYKDKVTRKGARRRPGRRLGRGGEDEDPAGDHQRDPGADPQPRRHGGWLPRRSGRADRRPDHHHQRKEGRGTGARRAESGLKA